MLTRSTAYADLVSALRRDLEALAAKSPRAGVGQDYTYRLFASAGSCRRERTSSWSASSTGSTPDRGRARLRPDPPGVSSRVPARGHGPTADPAADDGECDLPR